MLTFARIAGLLGAVLLLFGCGYTEEEMGAKQRRIDALTAQVQALRTSAPTCGAREKAPSAPPACRAVAVR